MSVTTEAAYAAEDLASRHALLARIRASLADFLMLDSPDEIGEDDHFTNFGTDSARAVEFKLMLEKMIGRPLSTTVLFEYPNLSALSGYLFNEVLGSSTPDHGAVSTQSAAMPRAMAVIAMAGAFPQSATVDELWRKTLAGARLCLPESRRSFGRLESPADTGAVSLGIPPARFTQLNRQQQIFLSLTAAALQQSSLSLRDLQHRATGVFVASQPLLDEEHGHGFVRFDAGVPYQIPLHNRLSFELNLCGPSEGFNTFCTSSYVALHRAVQCLRENECEQAIVGGINLISAREFDYADGLGWYEGLLDRTNQTRSFSANAAGFARSEGAGVILIKPLAAARRDGNAVLAVIRSVAIGHGGRGYTIEAPNPAAMKDAIRRCLGQAGVSADTIDYIEAHGIGHPLADAVELEALDDAYQALSHDAEKRWHVSSVKPVVGHPELASGMASLLKAICAVRDAVIPGIAGFTELNRDVAAHHRLLLGAHHTAWPGASDRPRRMALNSYAMGGVNAHLVLEEYQENGDYGPAVVTPPVVRSAARNAPSRAQLHRADAQPLSEICREVFGLDLSELDPACSPLDYGCDSIKVLQFVRQVRRVLCKEIGLGQALLAGRFSELFTLIERAPPLHPTEPADQVIGTNPDALLPTSEVQKGLWYIQQALPGSSGFNVPITLCAGSAIDLERLRAVLLQLLQRFPLLSVRFEYGVDETLYQRVRAVAASDLCIERIELDAAADVRAALLQRLALPFDLRKDLLLRCHVLECPARDEYLIFLVIHHCIFDGFSGVVFIDTLDRLYHQRAAGADEPLVPEWDFLEFVRLEQRYLASPRAAADLQWWRERLQGMPPFLNLPYDFAPGAKTQAPGNGSLVLKIDGARLQQLQALAAQSRVNLSVLLLALFKLLLCRLTGQRDIAVTTPVATRAEAAFASSVGCFINLMITRTCVDESFSLRSLLTEVNISFTAGLDHVHYPFPRLTGELGLTLLGGESPLPVSFTYQNFFDGLRRDAPSSARFTPRFDIYNETEDHYTLEVYDFRSELQLNLRYKRTLFRSETIARHLGYLDALLEQAVGAADDAVSTYQVLSSAERRQLLEAHRGPPLALPQGQRVHSLIAAQARLTPGAIAIESDAGSVTYAQLQARSASVAAYLRSQGYTSNDIIGVGCERSAEAVIAILGVLRAGCAYLPLEPTAGRERLRHMVEQCRTRVALASSRCAPLLAAQFEARSLAVLDLLQIESTPLSAAAVDEAVAGELAYVIFTSGSTGTPKGVMIHHRALLNLCLYMRQYYEITPRDRILQFAPLSFDMSVEEIFPYLASGATLVMRAEEDVLPDKLLRRVTHHAASILNLPPSFYEVIAAMSEREREQLFASVRLVAFGGEPLPRTVREAVQRYAVRIVNAYGPTEYTVNTTFADLTNAASCHIGRAIANTQLYVLDEQLRPVPTGCVGELCIGGEGLALGYLNQPDVTQRQFIDNPLGSGKCYRTGDLVRPLASGDLEYCGRKDAQLKIRGFRVEPAEIEASLLRVGGVKAAAVVLLDRTLVGFYAAAGPLAAELIRTELSAQLPPYMVPTRLIELDSLPTTPNGKLDRQRLLLRAEALQQPAVELPQSPHQQTVAAIWEAVLQRRPLGLDDNFFELGGHSLLAIQITSRICRTFSVEAPLALLFANATLRSYAHCIEQLVLTRAPAAEDSLTAFASQDATIVI